MGLRFPTKPLIYKKRAALAIKRSLAELSAHIGAN
jgi:hypothetical protein